MELAIIAGIGMLGWRFATKGTASRALHDGPPLAAAGSEFPFDTNMDATVLLESDRQKARDHVMRVYDPATGQYRFDTHKVGTGPDAALEPFVGSDKTGHVDSQRRMEMFTGAEDTWRHKSEQPVLFEPYEVRATIGSSGIARPTDASYDPQEIIERNVFGSQMNNVLPFDQRRVGPGIGVGADVPSADGLHSQFRVLPTEAMNAHRINQLPGRSASGAALAGRTKGGRRPGEMQVNRPSLVMETPGVTGLGGIVAAPGAFPMPDLKATRSEGTSREYRGARNFTGAGQEVGGGALHNQRGQYALGSTAVVNGTGTAVHIGRAEANFDAKETRRMRETPGMVGSGSVVASTMTRSAAETYVSDRRDQTVHAIGGFSTIQRDAIRPGVVMGPGRETEGRTELGALPGGVLGAIGDVQKRRVRNAFGNAPIGNAPNAQQRADLGRQTFKTKAVSEDPRTRTLGLGLF